MSRGIGEFEPIRELLPEWMAVLLGLVTQLGDVWFLSLVVALVYWTRASERESVAIVIGTTLTGFALIDSLKRAFALPRPDQPVVSPETLPRVVQPLYEATGTAGGYGFPSGHAFMTTIVYLSLVDTLEIGTRRNRLAGAIGLVAVVCFSRIALGVHYLVDVAAGVALGLLLVFLVRKLTIYSALDGATVAFGIAVVASAFNLLPANTDQNAVLLLGASLGAFGGWQLVASGRELVSADRPSAVVRPLSARLGLAAASFAPIVGAFELFDPLSTAGRGAIVGLLTATVVTLPVLRHSTRAHRVLTALAFWTSMALLGGRNLLEPSTWRRFLVACRRGGSRLERWVRARWEKYP